MPERANTDPTADRDPRSISEYAFTGAGLLPVGVTVGAVLSVFLPGPVALAGGAVAWFMMVRRVLDLGGWADRTTTRRRSFGSTPDGDSRDAESELDVVESGVDALETDAGADRLPVARGILDRARRYADHGAPTRASSTADRARRVADHEAAVRATLDDARPVRRHVDAVGRIEELLGDAEATASTDPERAETLVREAGEVADGLVGRIRAAAADRAEAARRCGGRGDPGRTRRLWSEAYELADVALALAEDGPSGDDRQSGDDQLSGDDPAVPVDGAVESAGSAPSGTDSSGGSRVEGTAAPETERER